MGRIYSRPRRLNKRLCFYLIIAVSTVAFVGYQWTHGDASHPLSLFSLNEYSSDLPENVDDPGPTNLKDDGPENDENDLDSDEIAHDDPLPNAGSLVSDTVQAASNGATQSFEYIAKKVGDTQNRMMQLFGLARSNLPSTEPIQGAEDNLPQSEVDVDGIQDLQGLLRQKEQQSSEDNGVEVEEERVDNEGEGDGLDVGNLREELPGGFGAEKVLDIGSEEEKGEEEEEEEEEEGIIKFDAEERKNNENDKVVDEYDEDEEEEEDKENDNEYEEEEVEEEEDEEKLSKKKKEERKNKDYEDEEKEQEDEDEEDDFDDVKTKKNKNKDDIKDEEEEDEEGDDEGESEGKSENKKNNKNNESVEENKSKVEEEEEEEEQEEKEEVENYDDEEEEEEPDYYEEENNEKKFADYSSKQEEDDYDTNDEQEKQRLVPSSKPTFTLTFNGIDSQNYDDKDDSEIRKENVNAVAPTDPTLLKSLLEQQGQGRTDEGLSQSTTTTAPTEVSQMQVPPTDVIQKSLGITDENDSAKIEQMFDAYRNATSDPEEVQDMTKQLVDETKERLQDHVSAMQLLKMKQELVRDGLSPEITDRLLSSPDPIAVARTLNPSAQAILRAQWDSFREKLSLLKKGSTLDHITASSDLLRPAEVSAGFVQSEDGDLSLIHPPVSDDLNRGTTLVSGSGYDNPRPISQDQFDKLNTPPGSQFATTTTTAATPMTTATPGAPAAPTTDSTLTADQEAAEQFFKVQVGGTLTPGSLVSFRRSPSGAAQIHMDPNRLPAHLRGGDAQIPGQSGAVHSLPLGDTPADVASPPEPLNLIPIDSTTGHEIPISSAVPTEQAGQPAPPETVTCPITLKPAVTSHPVTALVAFPGLDTDWVRRVLEQLSGEETDSIYKIMGELKDGHTSGVLLMGRKVAIETHAAATNDFERAIVVIENPFAVEEQHKTLRPPSVDWQKTFLWARLHSFWLHTDISLLVVMYEDLVSNPAVELKRIAEFLKLKESPGNMQCALEVAQKPPNVVTDITEISGVYSKDRSRINDNIEAVRQVAEKRFPDIVAKLDAYKVHPAHAKK